MTDPRLARTETATSTITVTSQFDKHNDRKFLCPHCSDRSCVNGECIGERKWIYRFKAAVNRSCSNCFRPILKSSHSGPGPTANWKERLKYDLMFPLSGLVSRIITLMLIVFMVWLAMWSILTKDMLPHGNFFGIYLIVVFALIAGYLVERIKLAPLLGMLIVGCVLRNAYPINYAKYIDKTWSSALRNVALTIILTRAGLGMDQVAIMKRFGACMSLAFIPTFAITIFITVVAHYMLDMPWLFSGALGFLISAVSPAVIVPIMLVFQEQKLGTGKGLPSLIIAAATICDVVAICGNGILLGIALSSGSLAFNCAAAPLQIVVGIGFGLLAGWLLWYFPSGDDDAATIFRFVLLICAGILSIFGSTIANLRGAGALGALTTPIVAVRGWKRQGHTNSVATISTALRYCWVIFQPILFGLIGSAVDISTLRPEKVGMIVGLLFAAHACQFIATYLATFKFGFSWKETLFLCISFIPKATIQAAIGSAALDIAMRNMDSALKAGPLDDATKSILDTNIQYGRDTLNCAVLAIIFFAPIGGVGLLLSGGKLLDKEPELPTTVVHDNKSVKSDDPEDQGPPGLEMATLTNGDMNLRRRSSSIDPLPQKLGDRRGSKPYSGTERRGSRQLVFT